MTTKTLALIWFLILFLTGFFFSLEAQAASAHPKSSAEHTSVVVKADESEFAVLSGNYDLSSSEIVFTQNSATFKITIPKLQESFPLSVPFPALDSFAELKMIDPAERYRKRKEDFQNKLSALKKSGKSLTISISTRNGGTSRPSVLTHWNPKDSAELFFVYEVPAKTHANPEFPCFMCGEAGNPLR